MHWEQKELMANKRLRRVEEASWGETTEEGNGWTYFWLHAQSSGGWHAHGRWRKISINKWDMATWEQVHLSTSLAAGVHLRLLLDNMHIFLTGYKFFSGMVILKILVVSCFLSSGSKLEVLTSRRALMNKNLDVEEEKKAARMKELQRLRAASSAKARQARERRPKEKRVCLYKILIKL